VKILAALLAATAIGAAPVPPAGSQSYGTVQSRDLDSSLALLEKWWPGQYDNHEQIVRQSGGGIAKIVSTPFHRRHTDVKLLVAPSLGAHVISIEQYADNDPAHIERREIAVFASDPAADAIRVKRYAIADWALLGYPSKLQPASLKPLGDGCDTLLHYVGNQFEGKLAGRCAGAAASGIVVASHAMWEMAPGVGWYQETRALPFTCNVFASPSGEMEKSKYLTTIHLHDQGGEADIAWPDGRTLMFTIHQRAFTATPDHEYPLFRIHEKGNPVPIAYAYAVDRNKRFGINLGWFYIRCYDDSDIAPIDMVEAKK
jgi:hypothetical protein